MLLASILAGCASHPPQPVEIDPADICRFCKMAISQKRYAAELVETGGDAFKFDDIGCMIHFAEGRGWIARPPVRFVHDYDSQQWLEAGRATFVRSTEIPSPMASGLLAVKDPAQAQRYATRFHGAVLSLADVWK